jgi:hypothetical protein
VPDPRARGDLLRIALVFAELAGCLPAWQNGLEGWEMTESMLVNSWTEEARREARILARREDLLRLAQRRFPGAIPAEVVDLIRRQDSEELIGAWFDAAIDAATAEEFLAVVRR